MRARPGYGYGLPGDEKRRPSDGRRRQQHPRNPVRLFNINFGPQHPAAHGVLRLCWSWTASWSNALTRIGLLHRGTES